jgi:type VI secretion system protein ImpK
MNKKSKKLRLADYCSDILKSVLKMRLANDFGDGTSFRDQIKGQIRQMETNAQKGGFSSDQTDDAKYALIAFVDELIITSDWQGREDWIANPLQMELYHRFDAGEVFFNKIEEFQIQPQKNKEVIEVYFICIGLGFKGKYALDSKENLESVANKIHSGLKPFLGDTGNVLSPSAISVGAGREAARSKLSFWYFGLGAVILGIIFYFVITLISINVVESAVEMLSK